MGNSPLVELKAPLPGQNGPSKEKINENMLDIKRLLRNKSVAPPCHQTAGE
jgi:hypothetical protein